MLRKFCFIELKICTRKNIIVISFGQVRFSDVKTFVRKKTAISKDAPHNFKASLLPLSI